MANLKELWRTSLLFRRILTASFFLIASLLVYLGSHIPRPVSLPADEVNAKSLARLGYEQMVLEKPDIAEGGLALSYTGTKNEVADLWLENATLKGNSERLFSPGASDPQPTPISYTTASDQIRRNAQDTCHTTIEIRRAKGSPAINLLKLYQTDQTAGAQRFRQVVLDAGETPMEIEVHTDAPPSEGLHASDLPGCHKLLTVGDQKPIDLPLIPIDMLVPGGKIDLHFNPANPAVSIWTGQGETFEAASLGDGTLRASGLQIQSTNVDKPGVSKGPPLLDVHTTRAGESITFSHLKLGSEMLRVEIGRDSETARADAGGASMFNYDLISTIQKNPIWSSVIAVLLAPAIWKWVKKNCFPDMTE